MERLAEYCTVFTAGYTIAVRSSPDFKLAYIDEGTVHFKPDELHRECIRLMSMMNSDETRQPIRNLLTAADLAMRDKGADIVVHPFPA
jgi:hypothetical protein